MILADLAANDAIFIDSNILIYHFGPHPTFGPACSLFMQRIEKGELHAFCSTHVLAEAAHQLMIAEASQLAGWSLGKVKQRLQKQPAALQSLTRFRAAVDLVLQSAIQVVAVTPAFLRAGPALSQQHGLLTNDALVVAVMQANSLTKLASHDGEFDRAPGLTRYSPA